MKFDLRVDGLAALEAKLESIVDARQEALLEGVKKAADVIQALASDNAPRDTGELAAGIVVRNAQVTGDEASAEVASTAEYSVYVEMGTGPVGAASTVEKAPIPVTYSTGHYIASREMKKSGTIVRFVTDGWVYPVPGGGFRWTRGQAPKPFMYRALKDKEQEAAEAFKTAVKSTMGL